MRSPPLLVTIFHYSILAGMLGRGPHTLSTACSGRRFAPPLMPSVCAVHAVMLGGVSPLSRGAWSRRTREAPGRPREGASEGRVERTGGARATHRIQGGGPSGRAGTRPGSPPASSGRCFIKPASRHGRYDRIPRAASPVPRAVACHGNGLRAESAGLRPGAESAAGLVPAPRQGRPARSYRSGRGCAYGRVPDRV
jgi:hypothetical protein